MEKIDQIISKILDLNNEPGLTDKMLEREFCTWIGKKLNSIGFYFKISDQDQRSKPFDAFGCFQGIPVALEFKKVDGLIAYPYKELRGSSPKNPGGQVLGLGNWGKNGGLSLVIVYSAKSFIGTKSFWSCDTVGLLLFFL